MVNYVSQSFSLDNETIQIIESIRGKLKVPRSEMVRCIFKYFNDHLEQLEIILRGD